MTRRSMTRRKGRSAAAGAPDAAAPAAAAGGGRICLRSTHDLSPCIRLAIERLRVHPAETHSAVDVIASAVTRALCKPASPLASFLLIGGAASARRILARAALDAVRASADSDAEAGGFVEVRLDGLLHARSVLAFSRAVALCLMGARGADEVTLQNEQDCNIVIGEEREKLVAEGKGVVFVVANFERFAPTGSAHSVLYKILDLLQDTTLGCVFIGMTSHHDAADSLEKRVKSRFSPHEIPVTGFKDDNLDEVVGFLKNALVLPEDEGVAYVRKVRDESEEEGEDEPLSPEEMVSEFNAMTAELLEAKDFKDALLRLLAGDRGVDRLVAGVQHMLLEVEEDCLFSGSGGQFRVDTFRTVVGIPYTSTIVVLTGLSRLEMTLVVALKRLEAANKSLSSPTFFSDVYEEYKSVGVGGSKGHSATVDAGTERIAEWSVAVKAWGRLVESDIVSLVGNGPSVSRAVFLNVPPEDVQRALKEHPNISAFLERWGKGDGGITS